MQLSCVFSKPEVTAYVVRLRLAYVMFVLITLWSPIGTKSSSVAQEVAWESLLPRINVRSESVVGVWTKGPDYLDVSPQDGATVVLPVVPAKEYDLRITFTRRSGQHSIGAILVHGAQQVGFEVDAWGKHLGGFQDVDGKSLQDNSTRKQGVELVNGQRHVLLLEVREGNLRGLLDGVEVASLKTGSVKLSVQPLWTIPQRDRLALLAWNSATRFHDVEYRVHSKMLEFSAPAGSMAEQASVNGKSSLSSPRLPKKVLLVIANYHFFYREYKEPLQELERAGIQVTVAAGKKGICRPHVGSGEGDDGGAVRVEHALAEVKAKDYDAILFSGGWGASMYQFAFPGRYDEAAYNGERAVKLEVNRLINEFLTQQKYVAALCNGTSILAWARVNGKSPLEGKLVCAPTREAAIGIYNGRRAQPSCRWHAEENGARMSPPGAIGNPSTNVDDVSVDGLILTGEDDPSAREMGRKLAALLNARQ